MNPQHNKYMHPTRVREENGRRGMPRRIHANKTRHNQENKTLLLVEDDKTKIVTQKGDKRYTRRHARVTKKPR
jgi:hypothetical protein